MTTIADIRRREQRSYHRSVSWLLVASLFAAGSAMAFLTVGTVQAPPTSSTFAYNTFKPGAAGFPALGGSYIDPVFGSVVRRLTARSGAGDDQMYARHQANSNGTYAFQNSGSTNRVINTTTGAVLWSGAQVPDGTSGVEIHWDALDPDKYYFYNGASLVRRSLSAQTNITVRTFPSALESAGGSLNIQSGNGRYFTVKYGGSSKVWDSQTNVIYSGSVSAIDANGWVSITPDGNYLVSVAGPTATPQKEHVSYAINHGTQSISSTAVQFWGLGGDHAVLISASDGKSYYIGFSSHSMNPGIYRIDITLNQAGRTETQQQASNMMLVPLEWEDIDGHFSAVSRGPFRNWVFHASENYASDGYNSSTSGWTAYKQEIMAINVLTGEVRRLAHHRSRGLADFAYWNSPRISCSWDGSVVLWDSNFNISSPSGYADMYAIQGALGLPAPTNLRVQ